MPSNPSRPGPRRRIAILGSTGSIGRQALEVIASHPDRFEVVALGAGSNQALLAEQAASFGVTRTGVGPDAAAELAALEGTDVVLNAVMGAAGLRASIAALSAGKTLALANKESLVAAGPLCLDAARRGGGSIVAVDSEHAALAQCLEGRSRETVARLLVTASGGPFRTRADLSGVTPEEALKHPTWSMGRKITIDSATLMNKALEVIEAHYLFDVGFDRIDVVVHPQSLVHAGAELVDGSLVLQAAPTDMRIPIQAALSWPERFEAHAGRLDLAAVGELTFEPVDHDRFPAVRLGYRAGRAGGTAPAVMNAANEVAVEAFLAGKVSFTDIVPLVESVMDAHPAGEATSVEAVLAADEAARASARESIGLRAGAGAA